MVKQTFNSAAFAKALRTKRLIDLNIDMKTAAERIGISTATLSRVESGNLPDLLTYASICYWYGLNMYDYVVPQKPKRKPKDAQEKTK